MSDIVPINKTVVQTVVRFSIDIISLVLNTSATFRVTMWDADNRILEGVNVIIDGQDYLQWSNNDDYVVQFISKKLGFTRK
jgi:hypothetical protein